MNVRVTQLPKSAYKVMPWKNGAGFTTELLIFPPGASVQSDFEWRISLAQVPTSGPFSTFPNYLRSIMLLSGDAMRLVHKDNGEQVLQTFQPYDFHGAWQTTGQLLGKPVEDFNVMMREGRGHAVVKVYQGSENKTFQLEESCLQFVWLWTGSAEVTVLDQTYSLHDQDSLLIEGRSSIKLRTGYEPSVLITVNIENQSNEQNSGP